MGRGRLTENTWAYEVPSDQGHCLKAQPTWAVGAQFTHLKKPPPNGNVSSTTSI